MEYQAFYRSYLEDTNIESDTVPMLVNCVGRYDISKPFVTCDIRNDWYLQIIRSGELVCDGREGIFTGQFVIRSPQKMYKYELVDGEVSYYCAHFTGYRVRELMELMGISADRVYTLPKNTIGELDKEFSKLFNEFKFRHECFEEACAALLCSVLIVLARAIKRFERLRGFSKGTSRLELSLGMMHQHFAGTLKICELARLEHMSESRYRSIFKQIYGSSPGEYITKLRLSRACELLSTTDFTVTEVARACGYADALYFSRIFNKKSGMSPREYRKANRKKDGV
ncbi:MAG: helix-turn-helix transcriptional regulator [Clostridia bacterium]|nr:helix-turn-helix transcriptional regulator [Clostridia bacterium]